MTAKGSAAPQKKPISDKKAAAERRRKQQQQQRTIVASIIGFAVLAVAVIVILIQSRPIDATIDETVEAELTAITSKEGFTGKTEQGFFFIGKADAPVLIEEFSSFSCPACLSYHENYFKNLKDKIEAGDVKFVYIPLWTFGGFNSENMARAAICAGEQSPAKFWEMHEVMFDWQTRYASGSNDSRRLSLAAGQLGLDTSAFDQCLGSSSTNDRLKASEDAMKARGVNATPTVYVDGEKLYPETANGQSGPSLSQLRGIIEAKVAAKRQ
ncbi:MAG TPA: thioredoxin domain-containing protein [Aggregatilineales bacterium]|nr:DsbA family protein [Anaerolineales bacterium]HRE47974.1 thioredoxin domain-containing protein [Aggregatilineales bacterium]